MRLSKAAAIVRDGRGRDAEYMGFPREHWTRIRTNNVLERIMREIRRRTRVVGNFPDGKSGDDAGGGPLTSHRGHEVGQPALFGHGPARTDRAAYDGRSGLSGRMIFSDFAAPHPRGGGGRVSCFAGGSYYVGDFLILNVRILTDATWLGVGPRRGWRSGSGPPSRPRSASSIASTPRGWPGTPASGPTRRWGIACGCA